MALPSYLFRLQTEGTCTVWLDGAEFEVERGDLLLLKPGSSYELKIGGKSPKIASGDFYLFCKGEWIDEWWNRSQKPVKIRIEPNETVLSLWRQIIKETRRLDEENVELTEYLLRALCLALERAIADTQSSSHRLYTAVKMKQFIEEHAQTTFMIKDVAAHARLSVSRASHFFKESYGKTIMQYALEVRLSGAMERMKHTSMTIEQIADTCGFGSYTYFHRVFKKRYGMSPTSFRKKERRLR
ncbi:Arabinose operon regulatory protein [Paenibacillus solanacearum]|uniref:Arabinose operon regulatory protein n=1 Tax=Paenibacillus solanacearum TaxID=2048548 RepID=A0A916K6L2_9BACL|nr:AraC family transcriptional regulator [Paenibacillus solanacearum]CAG7644804.1 Arabinose operon regulatory protein [Paenibacillus solanacearum]